MADRISSLRVSIADASCRQAPDAPAREAQHSGSSRTPDSRTATSHSAAEASNEVSVRTDPRHGAQSHGPVLQPSWQDVRQPSEGSYTGHRGSERTAKVFTREADREAAVPSLAPSQARGMLPPKQPEAVKGTTLQSGGGHLDVKQENSQPVSAASKSEEREIHGLRLPRQKDAKLLETQVAPPRLRKDEEGGLSRDRQHIYPPMPVQSPCASRAQKAEHQQAHPPREDEPVDPSESLNNAQVIKQISGFSAR